MPLSIPPVASPSTTTVSASGGSQTLTLPNAYDITLSANCALQFTGNGTAGIQQQMPFRIRQGSGGPYSITWPTNVTFINGALPTLTQTLGRIDEFVAETWDGQNFVVLQVANNVQPFATPNPPSAAPTAPNAPSITVTPGNAQNVIVFADGLANGAAITGHKIYRGTSSGGETLLGTISTGSPYTDTGLTNGTTYYYTMTAVNSVGEGAQSTEASATPAAALPAHALVVPTAANSVISTPATTANSALGTGTVDIRAWIKPTAWIGSGNQVIDSVFNYTGTTGNSYAFYLDTSGKLNFLRTVSGSTNVTATSTVAPSTALGSSGWVRALLNIGAGTCVFYTSPDGMNWTQLGTTVTGLSTTQGPTSASSKPRTIGGASTEPSGTTSNNDQFVGNIYHSTLIVGSTTVNDIDFTALSTGQTSGITGSTGEAYSLTGTASIS